MKRRNLLILASTPFVFPLELRGGSAPDVELLRVPAGGIQPQVVTDSKGRFHLVYLGGDPKQADLFYTVCSDGGRAFSSPVRVNSQTGSVTAMGTIRGAQLALGKNDAVHVAWNGSHAALP